VNDWDKAVAHTGAALVSDPDARFDAVIEMDASRIVPQVTWGTSPEMVTGIDGTVPAPEDFKRSGQERGCGARAAVHGPDAAHAHRPDPHRQGLHRFLHQFPHRRSARAAAVARGRHSPPTSSWRWWCRVPG
jgi:homoaconitase/3-isopropylmalate dehydratase large subunit